MTKTVHVNKPFTLQLADKVVNVAAGIQQLPDEIADHWFAKVHFAHGGPGAPEYAGAARDSADQQFIAAKEAFALYIALEATCLDAETSAKVEPTVPACERLAGWPETEPLIEAYREAEEAYKEAHEPEVHPEPEAKPTKPASGHRSRRP